MPERKEMEERSPSGVKIIREDVPASSEDCLSATAHTSSLLSTNSETVVVASRAAAAAPTGQSGTKASPHDWRAPAATPASDVTQQWRPTCHQTPRLTHRNVRLECGGNDFGNGQECLEC